MFCPIMSIWIRFYFEKQFVSAHPEISQLLSYHELREGGGGRERGEETKVGLFQCSFF